MSNPFTIEDLFKPLDPFEDYKNYEEFEEFHCANEDETDDFGAAICALWPQTLRQLRAFLHASEHRLLRLFQNLGWTRKRAEAVLLDCLEEIYRTRREHAKERCIDALRIVWRARQTGLTDFRSAKAPIEIAAKPTASCARFRDFWLLAWRLDWKECDVPEGRGKFKEHIASCPACRRFDSVNRQMFRDVPRIETPEASPDFLDRALARAVLVKAEELEREHRDATAVLAGARFIEKTAADRRRSVRLFKRAWTAENRADWVHPVTLAEVRPDAPSTVPEFRLFSFVNEIVVEELGRSGNSTEFPGSTARGRSIRFPLLVLGSEGFPRVRLVELPLPEEGRPQCGVAGDEVASDGGKGDGVAGDEVGDHGADQGKTQAIMEDRIWVEPHTGRFLRILTSGERPIFAFGANLEACHTAVPQKDGRLPVQIEEYTGQSLPGCGLFASMTLGFHMLGQFWMQSAIDLGLTRLPDGSGARLVEIPVTPEARGIAPMGMEKVRSVSFLIRLSDAAFLETRVDLGDVVVTVRRVRMETGGEPPVGFDLRKRPPAPSVQPEKMTPRELTPGRPVRSLSRTRRASVGGL